LGQTREVNVFKFLTQNSVEERVLALQDKKRKMTRDIFEESLAIPGKTQTERARIARLRELRLLLDDDLGEDDVTRTKKGFKRK